MAIVPPAEGAMELVLHKIKATSLGHCSEAPNAELCGRWSSAKRPDPIKRYETVGDRGSQVYDDQLIAYRAVSVAGSAVVASLDLTTSLLARIKHKTRRGEGQEAKGQRLRVGDSATHHRVSVWDQYAHYLAHVHSLASTGSGAIVSRPLENPTRRG